MSKNPVQRKFSRHIDICRYFVRDMVSASVLKLVPLRTYSIVADALTKSLPSPAHIKHCEITGNVGRVPFSFAAECGESARGVHSTKRGITVITPGILAGSQQALKLSFNRPGPRSQPPRVSRRLQ